MRDFPIDLNYTCTLNFYTILKQLDISTNGSVATTIKGAEWFAEPGRLSLLNTQQGTKYSGLPQEVITGDSQNLTLANHMYRLDSFN